MEIGNLVLWVVVILGSAYAGYLIGRWSVIHDGTLDEYDEPTGAPYNDYAGDEFREDTVGLPKGPAPAPEREWQPKKARTRTAKPPPALAGTPGSPAGGGEAHVRRTPSRSSRPPPAAAGLKS